MNRESSTLRHFLDEANRRLLPWVRKTLADTDIAAARFDKLVPRKDHYQLRICLEDSCAAWRDETFLLVPPHNAPDGSLVVGNWAIYRPVPEQDPVLALEQALSSRGLAKVRSALPQVNDVQLVSYTPERRAMLVVCGWGSSVAKLGDLGANRERDVLRRLQTRRGGNIYCLGETQGHQPRHPLYVRAGAQLRRM